MNREDEDILEFRYREMTWKHWACMIGAGLLLSLVISVLKSTG